MRSRLFIRHNDFYFIVEVEKRFVSFLSTMLESGIETVLEPCVKQVRGVTDELRCVSLLTQKLRGDVPSAQIDWLPRVVGPPDCSRHNICAVRYRRETTHIEFVNSRRSFCLKFIEHWRANRTSRPLAEIVIPKGIGDK